MADIMKDLCDLRRKLSEIAIALPAGADRAEVAADIRDLGDRFDKLIVDTSLTLEALEPLFETDAGRGGVLSVMDLCYNAFMIGRNMENREGGGRCDWFTDTAPLMLAGVERLKKDTIARMQYARDENRRSVARNTEKTGCTLSPERIDAGAACLYGHLEMWHGSGKPDYPRAAAHTKGKYQRAFASAVVASERVLEPA
jgi:hypothetical protein